MYRKLQLTIRSVSFMLAICFATISWTVKAQNANSLPPAPTGEYKVGVQWRYWVDQSRDETLGEQPNGKRELMVEILYPADPSPDAKPIPYMINKDSVIPAFNDLIAGNGITFELTATNVEAFQTHSYMDAPLSKSRDQYPILIFSHGAGGEITMYAAQLEELASHGYIVVAVNHPYVAASTVFPDGRKIEFDLSKGLDGVTPIMSEDQQFVMDQLETLNQSDPDGLLTGHLDLAHLGVFGHSVGGAASTMTCFVDKRCVAGVNEDGPVFGDVIEKGLSQPFLYMLSDSRFFYDPTSYQNTKGPFYELSFKGFEHLDFGDYTLWGEQKPLHEAMFLGSVNPIRAVTITRAYLLDFFDKYLKGSQAPLLEGSSPDYPEVIIQSRNT